MSTKTIRFGKCRSIIKGLYSHYRNEQLRCEVITKQCDLYYVCSNEAGSVQWAINGYYCQISKEKKCIYALYTFDGIHHGWIYTQKDIKRSTEFVTKTALYLACKL